MTTPLLHPVISPILVGRDEYLAALDTLAERVRAGNGVTLLVSGEAGIGKSRLVAEARNRFVTEQAGRVLQGNCFEHDAGLPYAPIVDLLHGLMARQPGDLALLLEVAPELVVLLPELAGRPGARAIDPLNPAQDKRRIQEASLRGFATLANEQPLLVIIEDIHWADDLSLELLQRLAQRVAGLPLLLIVTWRDDEVSERLAHVLAAVDRSRLAIELRLTRLSTDQTETMLRAIFDQPQPIRPDFLQTIVTLTDGNPFFIEEVVSALIAAGDIYRENGVWTRKEIADLRIPRSVIDAVQQRAHGLSAAARTVLDLAAVSGQRFDLDVIQELLSLDDATLLGAIRNLIEARLVAEVTGEQFAFRHALTREAIYARLLTRERRTYHLALGEAIERRHADMLDPYVADLSYHFHAAGAWEQCLSYARLASERARSMFAPAAEIEHLNRALDAVTGLAIDPPRDLYRNRALALVTLGQFERASHDHGLALDLARQAGDRGAEWQSLLDIGALWSGRDYSQAGASFQQALDLARQIGDQLIIAQSLVQLGNWQVNIERPDDARQSLTDALEIFETAGDRQRIAETLDLLGIVADIGGDVALMQARLEQAIALYRETNDRHGLASALTTLSCVATGAVFEAVVIPGRLTLQHAERLVDEALAICHEIGWRSGEAYAWLNRALIARQNGDFGRTGAELARGEAIAVDIEHREWMALACNAISMLALDQFDATAAQTRAEQAHALARGSGSLHFIHATASQIISACVGANDLQRASEVSAAFDPALPLQTVGQRRFWLARTELSLARDDASQALAMTDRLLMSALNLTDEGDMPIVAKLRGDALAALGRDVEAERSFRAAIAGAKARGMRPLLWQIHAALARLLDRVGRGPEADEATTDALVHINSIAAGIAGEQAAASFRDRAFTLLPGRHTPRPQPTAGLLTGRERDVALLVARGHSNREIAEALFIGERTVETHVGNMLGKLNFSSRTQIAAWVVESGLTSP